MDIRVSTENGRVPITIVHVDGNIDSASYMGFQSKMEELIKSGTRHILVDLSGAPFVSSSGLRAIHYIFNELRSLNPDANLSEEEVKKGIGAGTYKSPHLKLLNPSKETQIALKTVGVDMYIETYTNLKTAVASF
jgi:anti-anti-sigma factor